METEKREELIPLAKVQELLGIDYQTAKRMADMGQLTPVRIAHRDRFRLSEVLAILRGEEDRDA